MDLKFDDFGRFLSFQQRGPYYFSGPGYDIRFHTYSDFPKIIKEFKDLKKVEKK